LHPRAESRIVCLGFLEALTGDRKRLMKRIGSVVYSLVAAAAFVWMAQEGQGQSAVPTTQPALVSPFDSEVSTLESRLSATQTSTNPIIFYGSSSFRLWKSMQQDFPGYPILNCGFGGSRLTDCVRYANRLVIPRKPAAIVIYAGDNDLALGTPPEQVFQSFQRLFEIFRAYSPSIPIAFVSVKPSPARLKYLPSIIKFNELVEQYLQARPETDYIDICSDMLGPDHKPISSLFVNDQIHLSAAGYKIMRKEIEEFLSDDLPRNKVIH
jgi:lysophospholipase L1-like esterase